MNRKNEPHPWLKKLLLALILIISDIQAENISQDLEGRGGFAKSEGLFDLAPGKNVNETKFMQSIRTTIGGWLEGGYTINPDGPQSGINGPTTFNNRADDPVLDAFYLFFERQVDAKGKHWDIGWRADFLYGTDSIFTQAFGLDKNILNNDTARFYRTAIPQLYVKTFIPVGNGITVDLGHFYTLIGYETVTAPENFFYSHAYTMQYGEPFTHTGIIAHYPVNDNIRLSAGSVMGWNDFSGNPSNQNFIGRISWASDDQRTSLDAALITGDVTKVVTPVNPDRNRTVYSLVLQHQVTERLKYVFQHDFGIEPHAVENFTKTARWYGINQYLFYQVKKTLGAGLRFEWFRDAQGVRVMANGLSGPADYFEATVGLRWDILKWVTFRPEVRYDWMSSSTGFRAFNDNTKSNQVIIAADLIIKF
ncbi:hypothetical conserved protein [Candidatus Nitrosoglobus terrae]|uniref:Hypothetical conserved protein n=1 Tax=Candidatus Nitrosoglobus terrae TaxID=1630141 RepID=A0A1Q2SPC4_9GAMM|nr:porin [Candidatus Nitrosoglobus terrae]BAW80947.1 hypothetical conserved protein [Candidatus Nitrosoglobus terrae]